MLKFARILVLLTLLVSHSGGALSESMISKGIAPDSSAKTISEIRAAEARKMPLEVYLKATSRVQAGDPIAVTVIVTNLFPKPLMLNSRMLVNHPRLQGEISFRIVDASERIVEIQKLVTPLSIREDDFVILTKGESVQRTVDLADIFGLTRKGTYKVHAFYHNEVDFSASGQRAWKGRVWSEPIEIELN